MNQVRRILVALLLPSISTAACIPFDQARNHLDETQCVTGKVIRVQEADEGIRYLDFCEDYSKCPFTVVVFDRDLRDVGDVRQLEGKLIEIHGNIVKYEGRSEIVLRDYAQLKGNSPRLPPVPKSYDADRRGSFSATAKGAATTSTKKPKRPRRKPLDTTDPGTVD